MRKIFEPILRYWIEPFFNKRFIQTLDQQLLATYSLQAKVTSLLICSLYVICVAYIIPVYWLFPSIILPSIKSMTLVGHSTLLSQILLLTLSLFFLLFYTLAATNRLFYYLRMGSGINVGLYYAYTIDHDKKEIERHNISGYYGDKKRLFGLEGYIAWVEFIKFLERHPELQGYKVFAHSIFYRYTKDFKQVSTRQVGWARIFTCIHLLRNFQVRKAILLLLQKNIVEQVLYTTYEELQQLKPHFEYKIALYYQQEEVKAEAVTSKPVALIQDVIHQVEELTPHVTIAPLASIALDETGGVAHDSQPIH